MCSSKPQAARKRPNDENPFSAASSSSSSSSSVHAEPPESLSLITRCERCFMLADLCDELLLEPTDDVSGCSSLRAAETERLQK